MLNILFLYAIIVLILGAIIFITFNTFSFNSKLSKILKVKINYGLLLFITTTSFILFVRRPNVFDKIEGYDIYKKIDYNNVSYIYMVRLERNDNKGNINFNKKKFRVTNKDSIKFFVNQIKNGTPTLLGEPYTTYLWKCKIALIDSSSFRVHIKENNFGLYIIPYYRDGELAYYKNNNLISFFDALSKSVE